MNRYTEFDATGAVIVVLLIPIFLAVILLIQSVLSNDLPNIEVPRCPEDAVLVGAGQFEDGHWSEYVCGPAVDDFIGG